MIAIRHLSTVLPAALVAAAGCGRPFNAQVDLVGTTAGLPALSDAPPRTELDGRQSLTRGLDRRGWPTVPVQVARDQVGHAPTYATNFRWQRGRTPWDPAYPSGPDAVTDTPEVGQDAADAVTDPFVAAGMLAWAPIDMILFTRPWVEKRSPGEPYALVPDRAVTSPMQWFDAPNKPRAWRRDRTPRD